MSRIEMDPVPQEIVDEIIGYLSKEIVSLKACSVVSSSFRRPSQKMLFNSIILNLGRPGRIARLHLALLDNPTLSTFVFSLVIQFRITGNFDTGTICDVLRMVDPYVRELTLLRLDFTSDLARWKNLSECIQSCLLSILRGSVCQTLILGDVKFPATLLRGLSHLRHLTLIEEDSVILDYSSSSSLETVHEPVTEHQGYLESLRLTITGSGSLRFPEALNNPHRPSSLLLSRLRSFKIEMSHDYAQCQTLIDIPSAYLQKVHIAIIFYSPTPTASLEFSRLENLRILRLDINVIEENLERVDAWIIRVMSALPFQIVDLELRTLSHVALRIHTDVWCEVDAILTHRRRDGVLRRVAFYLWGQSTERSTQFLDGCLPLLKGKGVMVVRHWDP